MAGTPNMVNHDFWVSKNWNVLNLHKYTEGKQSSKSPCLSQAVSTTPPFQDKKYCSFSSVITWTPHPEVKCAPENLASWNHYIKFHAEFQIFKKQIIRSFSHDHRTIFVCRTKAIISTNCLCKLPYPFHNALQTLKRDLSRSITPSTFGESSGTCVLNLWPIDSHFRVFIIHLLHYRAFDINPQLLAKNQVFVNGIHKVVQ